MCLCCSQIDFGTKLWCCPFCFTRNHFPPHYAENITETNLPAELIPQFTTLEYQLPGKLAGPPAFLFVVDACVPDDELDALKDSLQQVCVCVRVRVCVRARVCVCVFVCVYCQYGMLSPYASEQKRAFKGLAQPQVCGTRAASQAFERMHA